MKAKTQKTNIDFSKYRTPELIETVVEIVSLPGAFREIINWVFYGLIGLAMAVVAALWLTDNLTLFWTALFQSYSVPAGMVGGLAVGIAEFVRRSFNNMSKLVDLLLTTTAVVSRDLRDVSSGQKTMPPTRDLIHDVYEQVILIVLREVLGTLFGIIGRPVYWLYRLTLCRFVKQVIRFIPGDHEVEGSSLGTTLVSAAGVVADQQTGIEVTLRWVNEKLQQVGGWIKLLVLTPCYVVLSCVVTAILSPILIAWYVFL